jgi:uncharacterized protein YukE
MSSIIHMETEQVYAMARRLQQTSEQIELDCTQLRNQVMSINWQGPSRDEFVAQFEQVTQKIKLFAEQGMTLSQRVNTEVQEWEAAAAALVAGSAAKVPENMIVKNTRTLKEKWKDMDLKARKKWLEDWYKELCEKLGIPPVDFKIVDLYDPEGKDAKGVFRWGLIFGLFRSMTIDIDNVKGNDPVDVLDTIAHETRHQFQHYLVENPDKRPPDVSLEQIKQWKENFKNYINPEDDFESYRKQPVEQDARDSSKKAVDEYLSGNVEVM